MVEIKLRTDADFKAVLQKMAKKDKRSLNKFIEFILEKHIESENKKAVSK